MKLYHGTSGAVALRAMSEGLIPRGRKKSTWAVASGADRVYLTNAYALYFAANASKGENVKWGVVEVDTDLLADFNMMPDEDFLEQATRGKPSDCPATAVTIHERTKWFKAKASGYGHHWGLSIEHLGTAAHKGRISPAAITRVAIYDPEKNPDMTLKALDPTISLMNYRFVGSKYRALTQWLFDETTPAEDLFDFQYFGMMPGQDAETAAEQARASVSNRAGIEIIQNVNYFSKAS